MKQLKSIVLSLLLALLISCSSDSGDSNPAGNNNQETSYSISGTVTDQEGLGVSGYTVTLSGSKSATTTTNSNGEYSFTDLEANQRYVVTVDNASYTVESLSSNQVYNFQVTVSKSVVISGTITDLVNNPVAGVPLTFKSSDLSSGNEVEGTSDANGHYEFNAELTPGRIWLVRTKSDEHRYAGNSDDPDVAGLDGRGPDEAAGTYRTTDVVVNFQQIDDLYTTWRAEGDSISVAAKNEGIVKSILSFNDTGGSFSWFSDTNSGETIWYGINSSLTVTKSQSGNIHYVVLENYEGIYEITKSGGTWTLMLEVVKTADGDTPPSVAGGFGSSNNGANGTDFVWTFTYQR